MCRALIAVLGKRAPFLYCDDDTALEGRRHQVVEKKGNIIVLRGSDWQVDSRTLIIFI